MGKLIWYQYSRLVSITAAVYAVWASFWGFFYRKFFWDFIGGTLRDPGGLQPSPQVAGFIAIIVTVPIIPIITMIIGFFMIALEFPLPLIKEIPIYRSLIFRVVMLIILATFAILFYQGTNAALYSLIAAGCYTRAIMLGETMEEAKGNRGSGGRA